MKPIFLQKQTASPECSFVINYTSIPHTYNKFHYHKEFELHYSIENDGTRFVGDSIQPFSNGDLVLVGPYLPHCWKSSEKFYQGNIDLSARVMVIHFEEGFLGTDFISVPEMKSVKELFHRSKLGIQFHGDSSAKMAEIVMQIYESEGWKRLLLMVELLCMMSESQEKSVLSSEGFAEANRNANQEKINGLLNYMIENYSRQLTLDEMASQAHMNTSAFCRYFKKKTSKTFSQVLNEIRIGFACRKILNTDLSMQEIAYDCGYMNVPYFNKVFKSIKGFPPQTYRDQYS